jgi:hypothetical protein
MNEYEQDLHILEVTMEEAQKTIDLGVALDRLVKNRDFKKLFLEEFCEQDVLRTVSLRAHPGFQSEERQTALNKSLDAVAHFQMYMHQTKQAAAMATKELDDHRNTYTEMQGEVQ